MLSEGQIRLLDVLPGKKEDSISCKLRVVSLHDEINFEALSYVWGLTTSYNNLKEVEVEGEGTPVTENLYNALVCLRLPKAKRTLWIDQLCIEQWNIEEKSKQVNLMRQIYQKCNRCLVWLGDFTLNTSVITDSDARNALDVITAAAEWNENTEYPIWARNDEIFYRTSSALKALIEDFLVWASRIWTLQEIVLPPAASVLWGTLSLNWIMFQKATDRMVFEGLPDFFEPFEDRSMDLFRSITRWITVQKYANERPIQVLWRWRGREATDPRDKVYGTMGLYRHSPFSRIQLCDYKCKTNDLFAKITLDLISQEKDLIPLVGRRGEPQITSNLPTWALDLVRPTGPVISCHDWYADSYRYPWYNACGNFHLQSCDWKSLNNDLTLLLQGVFVDKISVIGEIILADNDRFAMDDEMVDQKLARTIKSWEHLVRSYISVHGRLAYPRDKDWGDAFLKTLVGDIIADNEYPLRRATEQDSKFIIDFLDGVYREDVQQSLRRMCLRRAFFITDNGYLGLGPGTTKVGDDVWILAGGRVPFILRSKEPNIDLELNEYTNAYQCTFVGDAYVHNIMDGQLVGDNSGSKFQVVLIH
jgi:hypothetical protein